jgi:hypothetical protein
VVGLVAVLGAVAYILLLWDAVLAGPTAHPARALPLGRSLQASHDLAARRGNLPHLDAVAAVPALAYVLRPSPVEIHRLDDAGAPGWRPSAHSNPDLSRSPPGR